MPPLSFFEGGTIFRHHQAAREEETDPSQCVPDNTTVAHLQISVRNIPETKDRGNDHRYQAKGSNDFFITTLLFQF